MVQNTVRIYNHDSDTLLALHNWHKPRLSANTCRILRSNTQNSQPITAVHVIS
jgi:hypothetical protein